MSPSTRRVHGRLAGPHDIENFALSGRNLFPNIVSLEAHNFNMFSPHNAISDESRHEFMLTFAQIQVDMCDIAFYFRKKTNFPKVRHSGLADVLLGGKGLSVTAQIASLMISLNSRMLHQPGMAASTSVLHFDLSVSVMWMRGSLTG